MAKGEAAGDEAGGRRWLHRVDPRRRTSISTRLAVATLIVAIVTIVVSVVVSSASVSGSANDLIEQSVETRASTAASEIRSYINGLTRSMRLLSTSPALAQIASEYVDAYAELDAQNPNSLTTQSLGLTSFYLDSYLPSLTEVRGQAVDPTDFFPGSSAGALYLQDLYIAANPFEGDERRLLSNGEDDSAWTAVHVETHSAFRELADRLGFRDLMVVDASTQSIVYAVDKDVAFATSLDSGPHNGTTLAGLVRKVLAEPVAGQIEGTDVAIYPPSLDRPTAFLAAPLFVEGRVDSVLVGSLSFDEISAIMTQDWRSGRFGETGEMYLIGQDRLMRSDSRTLLEDPQEFFALLDEQDSVSDINRSRMEALGTSVSFQPVDSEAAQRGIEGQAGSVRAVNYLGREVLSAYVPLEGEALSWVLIVEQEIEEAESDLSAYVRSMVVITIVTVVLLTFLSVAWAGGFMAPVRAMSSALQGIRRGEDTIDIPVSGAREFRDLGEQLDAMVIALRARKAEVMEALRSKTAVIRTLMPDSAAERIRRGEHHLVEAVPQASIAVVVIDGLDEIMTSGDAADGRAFLHGLVDGFDALAEARGLERVKIQGDVYVAICGLSSPHIDHAPRAAAFARDAVDWIAASADERSVMLSVRAGIASGSVAAGLVGDTRLVFDLWGEPVDTAFALGHGAPPESVVVDRSARDRMPSDVDLTETDVEGSTAWIYGAENARRGTP